MTYTLTAQNHRQSMNRATCEWFLLCNMPAGGTVRHSILGEVPTCERCRRQMGLIFTA